MKTKTFARTSNQPVIARSQPTKQSSWIATARFAHLAMTNVLAGALVFVASAASLVAADYPVQPVPFTAVRVTGGFWRERQEVNRTVTVPFALKQCEDSKRLTNFDLAA